MENLINPLEVLLRVEQMLIEKEKRDIQIKKRLDNIDKKLNIKFLGNDFDVVGLKKASGILHCTVDVLKAAMKNGILKENIDYRYNGRRTYTFSFSRLQIHKGLL